MWPNLKERAKATRAQQAVWLFPLGGGQREGVDLNPSSGTSKWPLEGCDIIEAVGRLSQLAVLG